LKVPTAEDSSSIFTFRSLFVNGTQPKRSVMPLFD
jgi:hypothetical protein